MIRAGYKIECDDDYDRNLNNKSNVTYTTETTRYVKRESSHSDEGGSDIAPTHFSRYPQLSVASGDTDIELYDFDVGALTPKKRKQVKNACSKYLQYAIFFTFMHIHYVYYILTILFF